MNSTRNSIDSNSTRIRQQDQENQQQEKRDQQYHEKDYYYNNNYYYHTDPGVFVNELPGAEIMEKIAEAYRANISPTITQAAALVIENALRSGMEPATVILGIEETGLASRPSPYYLRAVLRNWAERGVVTSRTREKWQTTEAKPWWM